MSKLRTALDVAKSRNLKTFFGWNSIESTDRRRPIKTRPASEGFFLTPQRRDAASATVRDDMRNMTILTWMVRRHLDAVSRFTPHFRMGGDTPEIKAINTIVGKLLSWHAHRRNFDILGRHGRDEWVRMFEATKIIVGDCGGIKCKGGKLQGIEGERIRKVAVDGRTLSATSQNAVSDSGILFNADGTRNAFMVCKRTQNGGDFAFERLVPASNMIFDGYWPNRFDSDRGVSPLLTALNEGADVREAMEWHLLKVKAAGIFGFAFTRTSSDEAFGGNSENGTTAPTTETASYAAKVAAGIKARGLINLDLDPGDDVKSIESQSPNPNVIPFTREIIRSVLLSLDIPFTFYDSLTASFSARIADRNEYEESCEWKRQKNSDVLDDVYGGWLFPMWVEADMFGLGKALSKAGVSVEELGATLRWVPAGRPWLDRTNEMNGHILALAAGATSIPRICSSYGEDAYAIAEEQEEFLAHAKAPLLYAQGGQVAVQAIMKAMESGLQPDASNKAQNEPQDKGTPNE